MAELLDLAGTPPSLAGGRSAVLRHLPPQATARRCGDELTVPAVDACAAAEIRLPHPMRIAGKDGDDLHRQRIPRRFAVRTQ